MIRLSVLYPSTEGATFDHEYYEEHHMALLHQHWAPERLEVDRGVSGPYVAGVHVWFADQDALNTAFAAPGTGPIMEDVANYTSINPVLQISEIV